MIHPTTIIKKGANIHKSAHIGPYCVIDSEVTIAEDVVLESHVCLTGKTFIDRKTHIHAFASLGGMPQVAGVMHSMGTLEIGEENTIREHVTMHCATNNGTTRVGKGNYFMAGSHVGHDCHVGDQVILANGVLLAGHTFIDDKTFIGGNSAIHQWVRIGKNVMISGETGITRDVPPYALVMPASVGRLDGINFVGLKRSGFSKEQIKCLKHIYDRIFFSIHDGLTFQERVHVIKREYSHEFFIRELVDFITGYSYRGLLSSKKKYS